MSLIPLETSHQTGGNGWMRNSTEEISLFYNKINWQLIFAGGVNIARDFTLKGFPFSHQVGRLTSFFTR